MIKCRYEDGHAVPLRHVTVDALIEDGGKLLMIKRSTVYHIEPGKYALPGGFLERNESASEGIMREVLEETGYQGISTTLFQVIDKPRLKGDDRQNVSFVFIVTVGDKVQAPDFEVASTHWFPLNDLPPEETIGFDHLDTINLFRDYLKAPLALPLFN